MNRMVIEFDEEKITSDNLDFEKMESVIDRICNEHCKMKKEGKGAYIGEEDEYVMAASSYFMGKDWFKNHVKKWLWYNEDGCDDVMKAMKNFSII